MRRPTKAVVLGLALLAALSIVLGALAALERAAPGPSLTSVGPRLVSNQTHQPLALYGDGFEEGMTVELGPPLSGSLPAQVLDARHAHVKLPQELLGRATSAGTVSVTVRLGGGRGRATIDVVNDAAFPELVALARAPRARTLFAASSTTDELIAVSEEGSVARAARVADGPSALAVHTDRASREWLVIGYLFEPFIELRAIDAVDGRLSEARRFAAGPMVSGLLIDDGRAIAYIAEQATDSVMAISLATGAVRWRAAVGPNPRALALREGELFVGSLQTGDVDRLDASSGLRGPSIRPTPTTSIVGGGTERFAAFTMGGKAPRAIVLEPRSKALFVTSIGPNIGPNPQRHEVSMNGGVGVVLPERGFVRHLGFGAGVSEALALDAARGVLYVSDVALGLVRALDVERLVASDGSAREALLAELEVPPPVDFPLIRPRADLGVAGRAGVGVHSGPRALVLSEDGRTLHVLNRFTGTLARIDVSSVRERRLTLLAQLPLVDVLKDPLRRLGQVLYYADVGRTAMSCDACHLDGHTEGVLFEKTRPLRIYRSPTVRGARDTPPYFTPASTRSLAETARDVGGRNRYHNPALTDSEVEALAAYTASVTLLPNPFRAADGGLAERVVLPDRRSGSPRRGLVLFEGKAGCAACHPAPHFTTDQDPATRGRYQDVGTPRALPIREELQDLTYAGAGPPSLLGAWDVFPMLTSGAAGLAVGTDGTLTTATRFPLRDAVESFPRHTSANRLTDAERDDLLSYVMSL